MRHLCHVVIVDGYLSGASFAKDFCQSGIGCIHVSTGKELVIGSSKFQPEHYIQQFDIRDFPNFDALVDTLANFHPIAVVPGVQSGVEVADHLADELGLQHNKRHLIKHRLNKHLMNEILEKNELGHARYIASETLEHLLHWYSKQPFDKVVIKPLESLGSEGVRICHNQEEISRCFHELNGREDQLGHTINRLLLQEYMEGIEYIVNTVSMNGRHIVSDVWRYNKLEMEGSIVYERCEIVAPQSTEFSQLIDYTDEVLDCLGVMFGATHCEIMLTQQGPKLVELNPRICGAGISELAEKSTGKGQVPLLRQIILQLAHQRELLEYQYQVQSHAAICPLISTQSGTLNDFHQVERVESLDSVIHISFHVKPGDYFPKTTDLFSQPGLIYLVHQNKAHMDKDFNYIREIEPTLYNVS